MQSTQRINVAEVVFGQKARTHFVVAGTEICWMQDVLDSHTEGGGPYILRYCTGSVGGPHWPEGNMDVYKVVGDHIVTVADKSILHNALGEPTAITAVQKFLPPPVYGPLHLDRGQVVVSENEGVFGWDIGDCDPNTPIADRPYKHNIRMKHNGYMLNVDEDYYDCDKLVYQKLFTFRIADQRLLFWHEPLSGITVTRV